MGRKRKTLTGDHIAKLRDRWFESPDGQACNAGAPTGIYLHNSLERAFLAGVEAGQYGLDELKQDTGRLV